MRKNRLLLSIFCFFGAMSLFSACADNGEGLGSQQQEPSKTSTVVINAFDEWDDLKELEIVENLFDGSLTVNYDSEYVAQGKASAKYYVKSVGANNPAFKMLATPKGDITDVTEFGLYVYNANNYEFSVIVKALDASDGIIYSEGATAKVGANNLTFEVDRKILQSAGASVYKYQIAFNGVKSESMIYMDNFHVKTDSTKVELDRDVQTVIDTISKLDKNDRIAVENAMAQYKALDVTKRKSVYNYQILKSTMDEFWLKDLTQAKEEDASTLLYFDEPFAEVQISSVGNSISSCEYTTELAYGEEKGSLEVVFTPSSENWVTVSTTATVPIDEGYIQLHVYNASNQEKVLCIGWNGPNGANSMWNIKANSWLDITCPSAYLTANKGGIQIAGYDNGRGLAPEGKLYFSAVTSFDYDSIFEEIRVGEDSNTLFFFDREKGLEQVSSVTPEGVTYAISTDVKPANEDATLKVTFPGTSVHNTVSYEFYGYDYNQDDYAVFYVYNDTNTDFISMLFNYDKGCVLNPGEWTMVVRPVADMANAYLRFMGQNFLEVAGKGTQASNTGANLSGSVYITKAKVYSAEQVRALKELGETAEWNIGNSAFVGDIITYSNTSGNGLANNLMNSDLEHYPYIINGEFRMSLWAHDYSGFYAKLKNAIDLSTEDHYVAITLKGADADKFVIHAMGTGDQYDTIYGTLYPINKIDVADGYASYLFKMPQIANKTLKAFRITPIGNTKNICTSTEIRISNITIGNTAKMIADAYFEGTVYSMRIGEEANTLFFFDNEKGVTQITKAEPAGTTYSYATDKAYGNENGSLKVTFPNVAAQNTVNYDFFVYDYAEDDYVVFYIYNDTNTDFISLLFNYDNGVRLAKGEWTMIVRPVKDIAKCYLRFMGQNYVESNKVSTASCSQATLSGSVYISKAKVYPANKITDLLAMESTQEWTLGNTTFIGSATAHNGTANSLMNNSLEYKPHMINNELRMTIWGTASGSADYAGLELKLKTPISIATEKQYVAITLKGGNSDKISILPMRENGTAWCGAIKPTAVLPSSKDGYVTYVFEIEAKAGESVEKLRIVPVGSTRVQGENANAEKVWIPDCTAFEIRISDILFGDMAMMTDKGYLAEN